MKIVTVFTFLFLLYSCSEKKLLEKISIEHSGVIFSNDIIDNDSLNVLDEENIYNGGGVGIGDFNNDGLQDLYFTGSMVSNKLYLNKGNFKFEDVTKAAGVDGGGRWSRGVSVVDINNDGLDDIYISTTILRPGNLRQNLFYINQGNNEHGVPVFRDMAAEYGLNDTSHSTMAAFFDYDNDGDLDMYMLINEIIKKDYPNKFRPILSNGEHPNTDKLFRNDFNSSLGHPVFTDVSKEAGITIEGYGHGVNIVDINQDGWKDIYATNDFIPDNHLYINNGNGSFTDKAKSYFKHTAANAMGTDIADVNNDGLPDIVEADMNPEDNFRKKMMMNANSYQSLQNIDYFGYQYQYVRNTLQLNLGPRPGMNDSIGDPVFAEVAYYAGISETDWSWTTLLADIDNDGHRDLFITNGFPKDVTDHDFIAYRNKAVNITGKKDLLDEIPVVKIPNYVYRNTGDLRFQDKSADWGLETPSFSNGAVYADLDNDGDLDWVINNINDPASILKNNSRDLKENASHFVQVKLKGDSLNKKGIGALVELYLSGNKKQVYEFTPYRGYLSSVQALAHFGLGTDAKIDSIRIIWPDKKLQVLKDVSADKLIIADKKDAGNVYDFQSRKSLSPALFADITSAKGNIYTHSERDYIDFNVQRLLPHKLSEYGPALAVGDVDGNGTDDIITAGAFQYDAQVLLQGVDGKFQRRNLSAAEEYQKTKTWEDMGVLLFDADNDGDPDVYISSGGNENKPGNESYQDHFYINDGKGNFLADTSAIPKNLVSKSCVRAADIDRDGDLDLFIAGRNEPEYYPRKVSSILLRNDSKPGTVKFTDITKESAPGLIDVGLTCDMLFTDYNNDGWPDMILAGEWSPVVFLKNINGKFTNETTQSGISNKTGWWNSIAPGDFDEDGDIDYIVGNTGKNTFYRATTEMPVGVLAKDFDDNGSYDAIPFLYLPESASNKTRKPFPAHTRDDLIKQIVSMRMKFPNYKTYAAATIDQLFTPEQMKGAQELFANTNASVLITNNGNGNFTMTELPMFAQFSMINGMVTDDFNGDGHVDVFINTNDYGTETSVGRYDALNGLVLLGNGKGTFTVAGMQESGVFIPGNGKASVKFRDPAGAYCIAASQNRGQLKMYNLHSQLRSVPLNRNDVAVQIVYSNGKQRREECYFGNSFLSQSGRFISVGTGVKEIDVISSDGTRRKINL
ncbi:VCBS repeat-containing protein [Pollutibacter soli]|uniref:VCBS repeat-containing protein n=1 Tax=Pollutibacter soli TaxID=3034157 RepID=UPI0030134DF4